MFWLYLGSSLSLMGLMEDGGMLSISGFRKTLSGSNGEGGGLHRSLIIGELVVAVVIGAYISYYAKRELDKRLEE